MGTSRELLEKALRGGGLIACGEGGAAPPVFKASGTGGPTKS